MYTVYRKLYFLTGLLLCNYINAQQANTWYFGGNAGLDFNTGSPVALTNGQLNTNEGCSTISDEQGHLLFYTDSKTVWNKNHQVMQNGTGLPGHQSSSQSSVIVPMPGSSSIYYIFTIDAQAGSNGLQYSVVDMLLDNGFGGITDNKNVLVYSPSCEKITVTKHKNQQDYWIVTHGWDNNIFYSCLLTAQGLSPDAVISAAGVNVFASEGTNNFAGCMKISPDGSRLAACHSSILGTLELFYFNNETGVISNPVILKTTPVNASTFYGVEFSPDSNILYATNTYTLSVLQYNLAAANIPASENVIYNGPLLATGLQLGPDGRIYMAMYAEGRLGVINNPDIAGAGCNLQPDALDLQGKIAYNGLPAFVQSYFYPDITIEYTNNCLGHATWFGIDTIDTVLAIQWDFGDGNTSDTINPVHTYTSSGSYLVMAIVTTAAGTNTVNRQITIFTMPQPVQADNITECDNNNDGFYSFDLSVQNQALLNNLPPEQYTVSYYTSVTGAEQGINAIGNTFVNTVTPQEIYGRVTNNISGCYAVSSFSIIVNPVLSVNMDDNYIICKNSYAVITAPPGFDSYQWSSGQESQTIHVYTEGILTLTVFKESNGRLCSAFRDVTVTFSEEPVIKEIKISEWTENHNGIYIITENPDSCEYSTDDIQYQDSPWFTNLDSGLYTVYVRNKNGCNTIKRQVVLLMYPKFFTPNEDGIHETWQIKNMRLKPDMTVYIYNRYGKLISSVKNEGLGWDGKLNGYNLPADDYWFTVIYEYCKVIKGHFSLIR